MRLKPASMVSRKLPSSFSMTPGDAVDGLAQLGIGMFHQSGDHADELVEKRLADAHLVAVQHGAAEQPADDVALFLVAGMDVFVDGEGAGADVIGDAAQAAAGLGGRIVARMADFAGGLDQRPEDVDVEIRLHALQDGRRPLEAHAGVDVLAGQRAEVVGRVAHAIELGEDQVPDFDLAGVGVIIDFAARTADAVGSLAGGVGGPEVFVLAQPPHALRRQLDLVEPDAGRLVVVDVDGGREPLRVQAQPLLGGEELPGPVDGLALEVIAEAEVAQHLEEGVVIGGAADVLDVAGAEAFLAGGGAGEFEFAAAEEVVLELVHAGRGEEHGGVPAGDQHVAGPPDAALRLEEGQVFFPQFIGFHGDRHSASWKMPYSNPKS